jgi:hypothetical protein
MLQYSVLQHPISLTRFRDLSEQPAIRVFQQPAGPVIHARGETRTESRPQRAVTGVQSYADLRALQRFVASVDLLKVPLLGREQKGLRRGCHLVNDPG